MTKDTQPSVRVASREGVMFHWIRWILRGKPTVKYNGANCGLCGRWYKEHYEVPDYKADPWWDTWGLCGTCAEGRKP